MCVNEKVELSKDRKPHIFRSYSQVVMIAVCVEHGPNEPMVRGGDMIRVKKIV
jgi:hypothetical protein